MSKKVNNIKDKTNGVLQLFVVGSIGYMAFIIWSGLDDPISKLLTAPALAWAALVLIAKFTK